MVTFMIWSTQQNTSLLLVQKWCRLKILRFHKHLLACCYGYKEEGWENRRSWRNESAHVCRLDSSQVIYVCLSLTGINPIRLSGKVFGTPLSLELCYDEADSRKDVGQSYGGGLSEGKIYGVQNRTHCTWVNLKWEGDLLRLQWPSSV